MAQSETDIFGLELELKARLSLDWERIVLDPIWKQVTMEFEMEGLDPNEEEVRAMMLQQYLRHYLTQDRLLRDMPSTNGPGSIYDFSLRQS